MIYVFLSRQVPTFTVGWARAGSRSFAPRSKKTSVGTHDAFGVKMPALALMFPLGIALVGCGPRYSRLPEPSVSNYQFCLPNRYVERFNQVAAESFVNYFSRVDGQYRSRPHSGASQLEGALLFTFTVETEQARLIGGGFTDFGLRSISFYESTNATSAEFLVDVEEMISELQVIFDDL